MKLFQGQVGDFDVSIIVCGEDFSSNLAHKKKKTLDIVPASSRWLFLFEYRTLCSFIFIARQGSPVSVSPRRGRALSRELAVEISSGLHPSEPVFVLFFYFIYHR